MADYKVCCLYCRLRRRRCDGGEPCSRCQSAGFPEWCLYGNVRLKDKDSTTTLAQLKKENTVLKQKLQRLKSQSQEPQEPQEPAFFMGLMPSNLLQFAQLPGITGYLGSVSLPSTTFGPRKHPPLVEVFFDEIATDLKRHVQAIDGNNIALDALEDCTLATLVNAPRPNGDALIRCVLDEIVGILPDKEAYNSIMALSKDKATAGFFLGWPRPPPYLLEEIEQLVVFDSEHHPRLVPMKTPRQLVLLGVNMVFLSLGSFINSSLSDPMFNMAKVEASLYLRYANAIINFDTIGTSLSLGNELDSPLGILLLYLVHMYPHYTTINNFYRRPADVHKIVLKTRLLISRAKRLKLDSPNLKEHFPLATEDEMTFYTDLWYCLALLDVVDSLELGYHSSINPYLAPSPKTANQQKLNEIQRIFYEISLMDGSLSAEESISFFLKQISKLKALFTTIPGTIWTDFSSMEALSYLHLQKSPDAIAAYYHAAENNIIRTTIVGSLHTLYLHCYNATLALGETLTTSSRCKSFHILSHKYAFSSIEIINIYKTTVYGIAIDDMNTLAHLHILSITQFACVFESLGGGRATLWLCLRARDICTLTNDEIMQFALYNAGDHDLDVWVYKRASLKYGDVPQFDSLVEFAVDEDSETLDMRFGKLTQLELLILMICPRFLRARGLKRVTTMNLKFMNLTKSGILGRRVCSIGLRYCFPHLVREYENRDYVDQDTNVIEPQYPFTVELMDDTEKRVDFGALLGPTTGELSLLDDPWINQFFHDAHLLPGDI